MTAKNDNAQADWAFKTTRGTEGLASSADNDQEFADAAWSDLLRLHMADQPITDETRVRLETALRQIETRYIDDDLQPTSAPVSASDNDALNALWRAGVPRHERHFLLLQLSLMREVFSILRLDRFANAPSNRGWMNLFRSWVNRPEFATWFPQLSAFNTAAFNAFVDGYLRNRSDIEADPIHHPWDKEVIHAGNLVDVRRGRPMEQTKEFTDVVMFSAPTVFLDPGSNHPSASGD